VLARGFAIELPRYGPLVLAALTAMVAVLALLVAWL
jgi:hypothetical protein